MRYQELCFSAFVLGAAIASDNHCIFGRRGTSFRHNEIFSVLGALLIETSECSSFGITGTRPWPRWRHLPPSSLLSWWLLALLRSRKLGGDSSPRRARSRPTSCRVRTSV